jgi:hypothetical protein
MYPDLGNIIDSSLSVSATAGLGVAHDTEPSALPAADLAAQYDTPATFSSPTWGTAQSSLVRYLNPYTLQPITHVTPVTAEDLHHMVDYVIVRGRILPWGAYSYSVPFNFGRLIAKGMDGCLVLRKLMVNGSNGFDACLYFWNH